MKPKMRSLTLRLADLAYAREKTLKFIQKTRPTTFLRQHCAGRTPWGPLALTSPQASWSAHLPPAVRRCRAWRPPDRYQARAFAETSTCFWSPSGTFWSRTKNKTLHKRSPSAAPTFVSTTTPSTTRSKASPARRRCGWFRASTVSTNMAAPSPISPVSASGASPVNAKTNSNKILLRKG